MKQTIKKIFRSYIKTVWKNKFVFILLFWVFSAFIKIIEPVIFIQIIKKIEDFYKTWFFDINWTIKIIVFWWIFILFSIVIRYLYSYLFVSRTVVKNCIDESNKYSNKIIYMQYGDYLQKKQWTLYKIFDRWVDYQVRFLFFFFFDLLESFSWILFVLIILFYIDPIMALLVISMLPIMVIIWLFFILKVWPHQKKLNTKWESIFWIVWNLLSCFSLTKTQVLEDYYIGNIKQKLNSIYSKQIKIDRFWSIFDIYISSLVMISRIIVLWFWVFFITKWTLSFSNLFLFFSYIGWIYFPLWFMFNKLRNTNEQLVWIKKMHDEFDYLKKDFNSKWMVLKKIVWDIKFKNVYFWYNDDKQIIKNLNLDIKPWEKIALVWDTWAGKSTIVNLLLRFWDIEKKSLWNVSLSWKITIDWININDISKKSLRSSIWIVQQDSSLFNLSIKENLFFANFKSKKDDLEKALKKACADFVFDFSKWINTVIWERWLKLSGWEKQRLNIARLFLKDPKIIILDEATSALDNKTEKLVQKALYKLIKWRTAIIIAHRLSTIKNVDRIFVIKDWRVVETWTYSSLMEKKGEFYELANPDKLIIS
jgi:ATP-binding cassette, subfamily B, bacterial